MALKFHPVKRKVPSGPNEGRERYYGQIRCERPVSLEKLCDMISDSTSVTGADVLVVLEGFTKVACQELDKGNIMQLGDLGNLRIIAGSTGVKYPGYFKPHLMKHPKIVFTPGKLLAQACKEVSIEKMKVKVVEERCDQYHVEP